MLNSQPVVVAAAQGVEMRPAPITPQWVLAGKPVARAAELSRSRDHDAFTCLWDCTAGTFRWRFDCDETVHILDGEVMVFWNGEKFRLRAGDTAYFPADSIATWQVDRYVRKIAFLRLPPPRPVSLAMRLWRKLQRLSGGAQPAGLQPPAAAKKA